jgi:hypothetical protein
MEGGVDAAPEEMDRTMRGHLTDAEMTEALGGEWIGEARAHLAGCAICRVEYDRLRVTLTGFAEQVRVQTERSEASWERQRRQIASRLGDRRSRTRPWRWAWAPAAVGLAALAVFWLHGYTSRSSPGPEADHALLVAVEHSLRTSLPAALRPAALLAGEFERAHAETAWGTDTPKGDQL